MPPYRDDDDFLEEEWLPEGEDDESDSADEEPDEDDELIECPECGKQIYVESEQCPACGHYSPDEPAGASLWQGHSWWWVLLGVLGVVAVILALSQPW